MRLSLAGCQVFPWGTCRALLQPSLHFTLEVKEHPDQRIDEVSGSSGYTFIGVGWLSKTVVKIVDILVSDRTGLLPFLYQSEIQCSQECARTEWHRTSSKRASYNRELNDIGQFLTSERQEGSTDNVVKGDDFRADRGFRFGLFERTVIFFPGLTLWEDQKEEKRKTNLTIEKQEKSRPSTLLSSFFSRNWRNLSDIKYAN